MKNLILKLKVGSNLYGTNTPNSDIDYMGVYVPNYSDYFGISLNKDKEMIDNSFVSKRIDSNKNDKNAIDFPVHAIKKYFHLLIKNNPSIIEQLFVPEKNIEYMHPLAKLIFQNSNLFICKNSYLSFYGYAREQKSKLFIKSKNLDKVKTTIEKLKTLPVLDSINLHFDFLNLSETTDVHHYYLTENLKLIKTINVKEAITNLERHLKSSSYRSEYIEKYGYDVKFGNNLIRLIYEGIEIIKYGHIEFPIKIKDLLLNIKDGKVSLNELNEYEKEFEAKFAEAFKTTKLQDAPQIDKINDLLIYITQSYLEEKQFLK